MVYFLSSESIYWSKVARGIIDPDEKPFARVDFVHTPSESDLTAFELSSLSGGSSAKDRGYPVKPDKVPHQAFWGKARRIPDYASISGHVLVNARFRDFVEAFEPGIHQFFKVDVYDTKAASGIPKEYYWLNICNRLDSIHEDQSELVRLIDHRGKPSIWDNKDGTQGRRVHDLNKIGSVQLWINPYTPSPSGIMASTRFGKAAAEMNFSGLSLTWFDEA